MQIQNTDAINAVRNGGKLTISEGFPQNLLPNVQAVLDMTPDFHRIGKFVFLSRSISGTGTITTFSASRDTYITGIVLSVAKDAACDIATGNIPVNVTVDGTNVSIVAVSSITLTANTQTVALKFDKPIKVDRGSTAYMPGTFTAGVLVRTATVFYYEVDGLFA